MQKLYCYVDESGQDAGSLFFVVVIVIIPGDPVAICNKLLEIEKITDIKDAKWHKVSLVRNLIFLRKILSVDNFKENIFFSVTTKPVPYFDPMVHLIKESVKIKTKNRYQAKIMIDGIDKKKAGELTTTLRNQGISLKLVKGCRDENEPLIRLADRWAGCIRSALLNNPDEQKAMRTAIKHGLIISID